MFQYMHYWSIQTLTPIAKKNNTTLSTIGYQIIKYVSCLKILKNLIDQTSLISWSNQQKVTVHAITMLIQCCLISYPWYKPASLLYTIVLHECISVPDLESPGGGGGGISTCIWGAVDRGGHVYIYMHACYEDLHFFFLQYNLRRHSLSHLLKFYYSMYIHVWIHVDLENVFTQRNIFVFIQNYVFSCIKCVFFMLGYMYLFNF